MPCRQLLLLPYTVVTPSTGELSSSDRKSTVDKEQDIPDGLVCDSIPPIGAFVPKRAVSDGVIYRRVFQKFGRYKRALQSYRLCPCHMEGRNMVAKRHVSVYSWHTYSSDLTTFARLSLHFPF
jgi:hypothetical protein